MTQIIVFGKNAVNNDNESTSTVVCVNTVTAIIYCTLDRTRVIRVDSVSINYVLPDRFKFRVIIIGSLLEHMGWTFLSILNLIAYFVFDFYLTISM